MDLTQAKTNLMNFSEALENLKSGIKMQRSGWNAKNQWIGLRSKNLNPEMHPYFVIKTAQDTYATWVPSITDLFAEDWKELDK